MAYQGVKVIPLFVSEENEELYNRIVETVEVRLNKMNETKGRFIHK